MKIESEIKRKLASLNAEVFELTNESQRHHRPKGAETHFKLLVVAKCFDGWSRLKRQQHIYGLLKEEMASDVHALTMKLLTPTEWQALPEEERGFRALGHHPAGRVDD